MLYFSYLITGSAITDQRQPYYRLTFFLIIEPEEFEISGIFNNSLQIMDNSLTTEFSIGDTVVHPQHGVGLVSDMEEKQFEPNTSKMYYVITIKDTTLWVQVDNSTSGLRKLSSSNDLDQCIEILESPPQTLTPGRDLISSLSLRIKMGTIASHCEVVRDISAFGWHKPLFGPIADFQRIVINVLSQEWSEVKGVSQVDASHEINSSLKKGRLVNENLAA